MERDLHLARCMRGMRGEWRENAFSPSGFYFVLTLNVRENKRSVETPQRNETVMIRL